MNISWLLPLSAALLAIHPAYSSTDGHTRGVCVFSPAQCSSVIRLVRAHPGWRLASTGDNTDSTTVHELRDSAADYDPYYTTVRVGKRRTHFAVALTNGQGFSVYYFRWRGTRYGNPTKVVSADWLAEGDIRLLGDTLRIAPYHSDEIFLFVWMPTTRTMKLVPKASDN